MVVFGSDAERSLVPGQGWSHPAAWMKVERSARAGGALIPANGTIETVPVGSLRVPADGRVEQPLLAAPVPPEHRHRGSRTQARSGTQGHGVRESVRADERARSHDIIQPKAPLLRKGEGLLCPSVPRAKDRSQMSADGSWRLRRHALASLSVCACAPREMWAYLARTRADGPCMLLTGIAYPGEGIFGHRQALGSLTPTPRWFLGARWDSLLESGLCRSLGSFRFWYPGYPSIFCVLRRLAIGRLAFSG